ncbi:MAG: NB-ARC domain-containing protein [Cyanobacteriota bacterium]|nr:NB-ARC domain-containing protein [Cyanobacteriota bacterium]
MSSRSSRVAPDKINLVKAAVERNGFPSQKALAVETGLSRATVHNFLNGKPVDRLNFVELCERLGLDWQGIVYIEGGSTLTENGTDSLSAVHSHHRRDWGEAIDVGVFYGREAELITLKQWVLSDNCRLIALLGMGGIGKTALSIKFAREVSDRFDCIIWRSLREAPPVSKIVDDLIQILSDGQVTYLPESMGDRITQLIDYLRNARCLLILDNVESILAQKTQAGQYQSGYEDYGNVFRRIGGSSHQSCLILTSREKPTEVAISEGENLPIRSLQLAGLQSAALKILEDKGVSGTAAQMQTLVELYGGSPLALKIIATSIVQLFSGRISDFLAQGTTIFNGLGKLLETQIDRLGELDRTLIFWLAIAREPISVNQLREDILPPPPPSRVLESLENLKNRSLVETVEGGFTLQNVVMEYILDRLVEGAISEIYSAQFDILDRYTFIKATAKDYIRETQTRLILKPIYERLAGNVAIVRSSLSALKTRSTPLSGYAAGNLLDLLLYPDKTLTHTDFSGLTIRQAYLQGMMLHNINFQGTHFQDCIFSNFLSSVFTVAFSPDGSLLATGEARGEVRVWEVATGKPLLALPGHTGWVRSVAFSPDGKILASGSEDRTIRFWDIPSGHCLQVLSGHDARVRAIAFSPDGTLLVSCSKDRTIRLWETQTGTCRHILTGHAHRVYTIAFSPDGQTLASGSRDRTIKLWDVTTGRCLTTLTGHREGISSLAFHPKGSVLASGSRDKTIKLWDWETGRVLRTLEGHTNGVALICFHPDGRVLASGGIDNTTRLWNPQTGECWQTLIGHDAWVHALDFAPQGKILATGSVDGAVKLWDLDTKECLNTWQGYDSSVKSIAFSPDGKIMVSGSEDETLKVWDVGTGACLQTLKLPGPYEGSNITDATGLTAAQKAALQDLGAVVW